MLYYSKEDLKKFSDVEQEIIELLLQTTHSIKVPRVSIYSDKEIRDGYAKRTEGYMEVEWPLGKIIEANYEGYRIIANSRKVIRNMISGLIRLAYLAPMGEKLPKEILKDIIPKMGVFTESLRDSQSYIYEEELKKHEKQKLPNLGNTESDDMDKIMHIMDPENSKLNRYEHEEVKAKASDKVKRDRVKYERLEKSYILGVKELMKSRTTSNKYKEYTSKFKDGLSDEEEFIVHFNLWKKRIEITYEELEEKREILKFLTLPEIGRIVRNKKDKRIDISNHETLRINASLKRLEYKDPLVGWFPILDKDIILEIIKKYDMDTKEIILSPDLRKALDEKNN